MATTTTTTTTTPSPRDVQTILNYYDDPGDGTPPAPVVIGKGTVTNERKMLAVPATIRDVTGRADDDLTLDVCGFQFVRHVTRAAGCLNDGYQDAGAIKAEYLPECERLLKDVTGAGRVVVFEHMVRRGPSNWHSLGPGNASKRGPLHRAHIDQSYSGAASLARRCLGDEAAVLLSRRWQIINLWRPIKEITKDPLAVADARSVPDDHLVEARLVYPDHERRSWTVKPPRDQEHAWYYKHRLTPDEVILIKCFDSVDDGSVARRAPHSAFRDEAYDGAGPRESIEIRALVFYD